MVDLAFGATAMASIFAIVDPLGVVPFFSVLTEDLNASQKQDIVSKACLTATITLGVFAVLDRKSTRLNSSHSQISYAVFCLKKKEDTMPVALRSVADRARSRVRGATGSDGARVVGERVLLVAAEHSRHERHCRVSVDPVAR